MGGGEVDFHQVKAEHETALATLTHEQRRALYRIERAQQLTNFNHRHWRENLTALFESEAEARNCAGNA